MIVELSEAFLETLKARTQELAIHSGRVPPQVTQMEYEQAKREVMGQLRLGTPVAGDYSSSQLP